MFVAMADKTKISNVQKLYYLKSSLTGKAAERIKNLTINDTNYHEAWSMLVKRYDNERILLSAHMRKLLSCPSASKRSVDEILRLLDATNESIRAFMNMDRPVGLWDEWLVHILVHKLDPVTREAWESSLNDSLTFPAFDDLASFLELTVRALEVSRLVDFAQDTFSNSAPKQSNPKQKNSCFNGKGKQSQISVNAAQTESEPKNNSCPFCKSCHFISFCSQFKKLQVPQRYEKVQNLGLCQNCLRANHNINDCP